MTEELKSRLDAIDNAIDELFALFGKLSPRQAAARPAHLRDGGDNDYEVVAGLMRTKARKALP